MEMAIADPAYAHLPEARRAGRRCAEDDARRRASGGCSRPSCGWACSTSRTSTRTAPARCSPTPRTARWPARAAERSAVLLRNEGDLLPLDAGGLGSVAVHRPAGRLAARHPRPVGASTSTSTRPSRCSTGIRRAGRTGVDGRATRPASARRSASSRRCSTCSAATRPVDPEGFDDEAELRARGRAGARTPTSRSSSLGEWQNMIGEAASRSSLELPGRQLELLQAVVATGTPVVLLVMNGRPLDLRWAAEHVPAILDIWYPGTQGGAAVANLLFGDVAPGGKLPFTWPRTVGQVPMIYCAHHLARAGEPGPALLGRGEHAAVPVRARPELRAASSTRRSRSTATRSRPDEHRDRVGRRHQHRARGRPTRSCSSTSTSATAPRRGRCASSRASSGSRSPPARRARSTFALGPDRAALLERRRARLGARRLDVRRLGRRRLDGRPGDDVPGEPGVGSRRQHEGGSPPASALRERSIGTCGKRVLARAGHGFSATRVHRLYCARHRAPHPPPSPHPRRSPCCIVRPFLACPLGRGLQPWPGTRRRLLRPRLRRVLAVLAPRRARRRRAAAGGPRLRRRVGPGHRRRRRHLAAGRVGAPVGAWPAGVETTAALVRLRARTAHRGRHRGQRRLPAARAGAGPLAAAGPPGRLPADTGVPHCRRRRQRGVGMARLRPARAAAPDVPGAGDAAARVAVGGLAPAAARCAGRP